MTGHVATKALPEPQPETDKELIDHFAVEHPHPRTSSAQSVRPNNMFIYTHLLNMCIGGHESNGEQRSEIALRLLCLLLIIYSNNSRRFVEVIIYHKQI